MKALHTWQAPPIRDAPLGVELANTRRAGAAGRIRDTLADPEARRLWLATNAGRLPPGAVAAGDLGAGELRALRDAVRALLDAVSGGTAPPPAALTLVNAAAAGAPVARLLCWTAGVDAPRAEQSWVAADSVATLLGALAGATIDLLASPDRALVRRCGAPGCILFFVRSRRRREWCSAACGNRARVARHRAGYRQTS